ncbi:hypothetical protein VTP01DRAFT_3392 [Rhizomucor pusillus]|uniref:uncharacterized protein n=1 Tax=Rhizomucor pusillus TaxID=4840 RepID=UPI0037436222
MLAITTAAPSDSASKQHEWLPMPRGLEEDDSFSQDLIRQFDKRRSRLHAEMSNQLSQRWSIHYQPDTRHSSLTASIVSATSAVENNNNNNNNNSNNNNSNNNNDNQQQQASLENENPADRMPQQQPGTPAAEPEAKRRRRSANALLRRSSAYLRAKFEAFRAASSRQDEQPPPPLPSSSRQIESKRSTVNNRPRSMISASLPVRKRKRHHYPRADSTFSASATSLPLPSTIAINTTITIPHYQSQMARYHEQQQQQQYVQYATIQPPVITHFPPKPLKYSPVDPPSDSIGTSNDGTEETQTRHRMLHRFSVPVFNRRSDTRSHASPSSEIDTRPRALPSFRRRWSHLFGCGRTKKAKGNAPASSSSVAVA